MSLLAILLVAIPIGIGLLALMVARPASRDSGELLGLRSARQIISDREALDAEDLAQLLEASNARRRGRGEPERTVEDLEFEVASQAVRPGGPADRRGSGPSRPR